MIVSSSSDVTVIPAGPRGKGWVFGKGAPDPGLGAVGDMYFDTVAFVAYGPKPGATWAGAPQNDLKVQAAEAVAAAELAAESLAAIALLAEQIEASSDEVAINAIAAADAAEAAALFDPASYYTQAETNAAIGQVASGVASTSVAGLVELATEAETLAGTSATHAVTPLGLAASILAIDNHTSVTLDVFTQSATFTKQANDLAYFVVVIGAGAHGQAGGASGAKAGGAGGGYVEGFIAASEIGTTASVIVGAGGSTGGKSSFGALEAPGGPAFATLASYAEALALNNQYYAEYGVALASSSSAGRGARYTASGGSVTTTGRSNGNTGGVPGALSGTGAAGGTGSAVGLPGATATIPGGGGGAGGNGDTQGGNGGNGMAPGGGGGAGGNASFQDSPVFGTGGLGARGEVRVYRIKWTTP